MRILALDAATEACSVALLLDGRVLCRSVESGRSNSAQILAMISELLSEGQTSLGHLDCIAASIGPGAFTGVRVTVAVAQGLAFGAGLPTVGVNTLEALAFSVLLPGDGYGAAACLDARMSEVYWGCYVADAPRGVTATTVPAVGPPGSVRLPSGQAYRGVGRGFSAYPELGRLPGLHLDPASAMALPNAREIVRLGALRFTAGEATDAAELTPLYLRDKVAFTTAERAARSQ
jgi:tRNA threonylcarbamoyladenosine biosynthesis protein TsaB